MPYAGCRMPDADSPRGKTPMPYALHPMPSPTTRYLMTVAVSLSLSSLGLSGLTRHLDPRSPSYANLVSRIAAFRQAQRFRSEADTRRPPVACDRHFRNDPRVLHSLLGWTDCALRAPRLRSLRQSEPRPCSLLPLGHGPRHPRSFSLRMHRQGCRAVSGLVADVQDPSGVPVPGPAPETSTQQPSGNPLQARGLDEDHPTLAPRRPARDVRDMATPGCRCPIRWRVELNPVDDSQE